MSDWLYESLKTISNLCKVAQLLIETGNREYLATVIELLFQEAQSITEEHCVINEE